MVLTEELCRYLEQDNQGQESCFFLNGPCRYQNNRRICDISEYYSVPGHCPSCGAFYCCNCIKARLNGKDRTIGWICKKCFYYIIFPLGGLKKS